jgi:hypothetical protein
MVDTAVLRAGAARLNLAKEAMHWVVEAIVGAWGRAHGTRPGGSYRVLPATTTTSTMALGAQKKSRGGSIRPLTASFSRPDALIFLVGLSLSLPPLGRMIPAAASQLPRRRCCPSKTLSRCYESTTATTKFRILILHPDSLANQALFSEKQARLTSHDEGGRDHPLGDSPHGRFPVHRAPHDCPGQASDSP